MATEINIHDSFYLHPSDTPGMNLINEQLTGTENYGIWSRAMLIALRAKNKIGFVDGSCAKPEEDLTRQLHWERCNALVLSWIMNTVNKDIFNSIIYASNASVVWKDLKERFDKVNGTRIYTLHKEIGSLIQGTMNVSTYFSKLKQLWDEFASLIPLPSCDCENARNYVAHDQQQKLLQFLMGLNESYGNVRGQILMMSPLPALSQAFSIVVQEESHRLVTSNCMSVDLTSSALLSSSNTVTRNLGVESERCGHCNWPGHKRETCYRLIGYPPGHRLHKRNNKNQNYSRKRAVANQVSASSLEEHQPVKTAALDSVVSSSPTFTPEQYDQILQLLAKTTIQPDPSANFAVLSFSGPMDWTDHGDW